MAEKSPPSSDLEQNVDAEKPTFQHGEQEAPFSAKETRSLLRKVDINLLPLLAIMYLLSFLDRSNIGNAKLAGMEEDLGMTGKWDYSVSPVNLSPQGLPTDIRFLDH